jgi:hypothetical protein
MDVESLTKQLILKGMTQEQQKSVLDSVKRTMQEARTVQKQRVGENVQVVIQALKKMEADIKARFDDAGKELEKRYDNILVGKDGRDGADGKNGQDGKDGRDGLMGPRGADGLNGQDGADGVSVTDAKIDFDGSLVITLSTGREINVGEVVAPDLAEKIKVITNGGGTSQQVLDVIAALQATIATYGTMALQNANAVAITGGTINGTTIGGATPAAGTFTTLTATGQTDLGTGSANFLRATGAASGAAPDLLAQGTDANIGIDLITKGSGSFRINNAGGTVAEFNDGGAANPTNSFLFAAGGGGIRALIRAMGGPMTLLSTGANPVNFATNGSSANIQAAVSNTNSAVNFVQVNGAATGNATRISTQGSDANVGMDLVLKGNPVGPGFRVQNQGGTGTCFSVLVSTASVVNHPRANPSAAGNPVSFSAEGTDTNIGLNLNPKGTGTVVANGPFTATGQTSLGGAAGAEGLRVVNTASSVGYWKAQAGTGAPSFSRAGFGYDVGNGVSMSIYNSGSQPIRFDTAGYNTNTQFLIANTASAVNYVQVTGAATGGSVVVSAQGSDANVPLNLQAKGSSYINAIGWMRVGTASANYIQLQAAGAGSAPVYTVQGTDTNIDLVLTPKGTGLVRFGTYTASMALTVQGYVEVKDSGGTIRKLAVIA